VPRCNTFKLSTPLPETCEGLLFKKALCYNLCALFDRDAEYVDSSQPGESLISKILFFVSENYRGECNLSDIAHFVGYDYSYVSKFFKKATGMTLKAYVSGLRISDACRMLSHTNKTVREIAEECGFPSQRTFNRDFLKETGKTPVEYRKKP
jgi:AraC-like DNA-binding protein